MTRASRWPGLINLVPLLYGLMTATASAETVKMWKWVDQDGKVHYSESRPPPQAVKAEEKHINPDQNTYAGEGPSEGSRSSGEPRSRREDDDVQAPSGRNAGSQSGSAGGGAASTAPPSAPAVTPPPPPTAVPSLPQPPIAPPPPPGGF